MPFVSSVRGTLGLIKRPYPISDGKGSAASTGGTITTFGAYRIHRFTSVGNSTFTFAVAENIGGNGSARSDGTPNTGAVSGAVVEYLIIGGGGGGGSWVPGGGGAGGYRTGYAVATSGSNTITVGGGGKGAYNPGGYGNLPGSNSAANGGDSSAFGITSAGGGRGVRRPRRSAPWTRHRPWRVPRLGRLREPRRWRRPRQQPPP